MTTPPPLTLTLPFQLDLHYSVNCDRASAKFDKSRQVLTVTLPVVPRTPHPNSLLPPVSPPPQGDRLQREEVCSGPAEKEKMKGTYVHVDNMFHACMHTNMHSHTLTHTSYYQYRITCVELRYNWGQADVPVVPVFMHACICVYVHHLTRQLCQSSLHTLLVPQPVQ